MGNLSSWFGWTSTGSTNEELPEIFPVSINSVDYIKIDVVNIYAKILTDVLERTAGLDEKQQALLWDNCVKSDSSDGVITLLATAMYEKEDLFLVYAPELGVIRRATSEERSKIEADYKKSAESSTGIFISFKNYSRSDMVKVYSGLEYCTVSALSKSMNLAKAIQIKVKDLRESVSLKDSADAVTQAKSIATALMNGKDIMCDAEDVIETAKPDLTATEKSIDFINQKRAFYLGLPAAYITGEQTGGLGTTGENDTKAIERGLKNYFESIIKPAMFAIFKKKVKYKSQDFRQVTQANETIKTLTLVDESLITHENKKKIVEGLYDIDPDTNVDTEEPAKLEEPPNGQANGNGKAPAEKEAVKEV